MSETWEPDPPSTAPAGSGSVYQGCAMGTREECGAELLPIPTVRGEPVRGGVAGMFFGGSGGGAAKQSRERRKIQWQHVWERAWLHWERGIQQHQP